MLKIGKPLYRKDSEPLYHLVKYMFISDFKVGLSSLSGVTPFSGEMLYSICSIQLPCKNAALPFFSYHKPVYQQSFAKP